MSSSAIEESTEQHKYVDVNDEEQISADSGRVQFVNVRRQPDAAVINLMNDQLIQLYKIDDDPGRVTFLNEYFIYMQKKGTRILRIPVLAKYPLDLYKLYKVVQGHGGFCQVVKKRKWSRIVRELNISTTVTSAAFTLRTQYSRYLYSFECSQNGLPEPEYTGINLNSNDPLNSIDIFSQSFAKWNEYHPEDTNEGEEIGIKGIKDTEDKKESDNQDGEKIEKVSDDSNLKCIGGCQPSDGDCQPSDILTDPSSDKINTCNSRASFATRSETAKYINEENILPFSQNAWTLEDDLLMQKNCKMPCKTFSGQENVIISTNNSISHGDKKRIKLDNTNGSIVIAIGKKCKCCGKDIESRKRATLNSENYSTWRAEDGNVLQLQRVSENAIHNNDTEEINVKIDSCYSLAKPSGDERKQTPSVLIPITEFYKRNVSYSDAPVKTSVTNKQQFNIDSESYRSSSNFPQSGIFHTQSQQTRYSTTTSSVTSFPPHTFHPLNVERTQVSTDAILQQTSPAVTAINYNNLPPAQSLETQSTNPTDSSSLWLALYQNRKDLQLKSQIALRQRNQVPPEGKPNQNLPSQFPWKDKGISQNVDPQLPETKSTEQNCLNKDVFIPQSIPTSQSLKEDESLRYLLSAPPPYPPPLLKRRQLLSGSNIPSMSTKSSNNDTISSKYNCYSESNKAQELYFGLDSSSNSNATLTSLVSAPTNTTLPFKSNYLSDNLDHIFSSSFKSGLKNTDPPLKKTTSTNSFSKVTVPGSFTFKLLEQTEQYLLLEVDVNGRKYEGTLFADVNIDRS